MKTLLLNIALMSLTFSSVYAETVSGTLSNVYGSLILTQESGNQIIISPSNETIYKRISSHVRPLDYILEFEGTLKGNTLETADTPVILGDYISATGLLSGTPGVDLEFNGHPAKFGTTKVINGTSFDNASKLFFKETYVDVQGHYEGNVFVINSIIEAGLLTATSSYYINDYDSSFENDPYGFVLNQAPQNYFSQGNASLKGTIHSDSNYQVEADENVLIITLSGRQGDDIQAAGGHFAIGFGKVQKDEVLSIKGELSNFYFEGEKEILAGSTDLVSYFGHLVQGQQNFRPTYTLMMYGVNKEQLNQIKEQMEVQLERVRSEEGLAISQYYNCTTTSVNSLEHVGIVGALSPTLDNQFNITQLIAELTTNGIEISKKMLSEIKYITQTDMSKYIPRNAFDSFIQKFSSAKEREKFGIKRMDYIFIPQTASAREVGGAAYNDVFEGLQMLMYKGKKVSNEVKNSYLNSID